MRAKYVEPLVTQDTDHSRQQAIIARERSAADTGQDTRALRIRTQVQERWPTYWPHQDQVRTPGAAQRCQNTACRPQPDPLMRKRRHDTRVRVAVQGDNEHGTACGLRHPCNPPR